jgi:hypothetical protein
MAGSPCFVQQEDAGEGIAGNGEIALPVYICQSNLPAGCPV